MSALIKKPEKSKINDLMIHFKPLEKSEHATAKSSTWKDTIKTRVQINEMETIRTIRRINEIKSWFFEKINKIDKHSKLPKRKRKKTQINKIRYEKEDINENINEIQRNSENH
jgi:hypothetical protein